ncbi:MAG: hypothetical protein JJT93_03230 [Gammaproteobacteria bacterium]|nr:hypothetical protein [Gammaproteobacteria bacterium]TVQ44284.1 MAG: hypothetical protein EA371_13605 [Gammaproteobacteria bacterium]
MDEPSGAPAQIDPRARRALRRQAVVSLVVLLACIPAFAWVILTRELSFAGSFGLFGGHWMLGVLMPIAVLALVSLVHALQRLGVSGVQSPPDHPTDGDAP